MKWLRLVVAAAGIQAGGAAAQCEMTYLEAPGLAPLSNFGASMAESEGALIIGAPGSRYAGYPSGRVFEFQRDGGAWSAREVIEAPGTHTRFGHSIAIDGDTLVVGAPDYGPPYRSGAAQVYRRDGSGWRHEATLLAPDAAVTDRFGWSIAVEGDTIAIGAPFRREIEDESGAVYFFRRSGGDWSFDGKVVHDTVQWRNYFGYSVRLLHDESCMITAQGSGEERGAVLWYTRDAGQWQLRQKITVPGTFGLGRALDVRGDVLATTGSSETLQTSAVFLYQFDGAQWQPLHTMTAEFSWRLSRAVALGEGRVLVGAPNYLRSSQRAGHAHLFRFDAASWEHQDFITADPWRRVENFGVSVIFAAGDPLVGGVSDERLGIGVGVVAALAQPLACACPGDFNRDGARDFFDWLEYLSAFAAGEPRADLDDDGEIESSDFLHFQVDFEAGCWG